MEVNKQPAHDIIYGENSGLCHSTGSCRESILFCKTGHAHVLLITRLFNSDCGLESDVVESPDKQQA